eukprot:CAMPEP_0184480312 /NCGR_PEP_ID=MMETSP0113_2-20130426/1801_1 /TAXON_ID=91329 /ORGANISM="Norrisiella sphaerica, Strain BC52" /LENGTH=315 /DNA_ID=CAMNT_0026858701 /DNA_START=190 /DNA_END=1138 /DNA_ORIENTATION=+
MQFLADYFKNAVKGTKTVVRSYRYIRRTKPSRDAFMENLMSAFRTMDAKRGVGAARKASGATPGITKQYFVKLLKMLCDDFPLDVIDGIFQVLRKTNDDPIDFREFCGGVYACLVYEEFFEQVEWVFKCADTENNGTISGQTLMQVIEEVKRKQNPLVQVPSDAQLRNCLREADIDPAKADQKQLCFQEFAMAMFRVCIPPPLKAKVRRTDSKLDESGIFARDREQGSSLANLQSRDSAASPVSLKASLGATTPKIDEDVDDDELQLSSIAAGLSASEVGLGSPASPASPSSPHDAPAQMCLGQGASCVRKMIAL